MTLAKNLLTGASICALFSVPTLVRADPQIHLVGADNLAQIKPGSVHMKTRQGAGDIQDVTYTITFSAKLPKKNVKTLLWTETWVDAKTCKPPRREQLKIPKKTPYAKLSVGTSTGPTTACPNSNFTMFGPVYDLIKNTSSDSFKGRLEARHYGGYDLTLIVNTELF